MTNLSLHFNNLYRLKTYDYTEFYIDCHEDWIYVGANGSLLFHSLKGYLYV